ncbi:tyrosine-type recombinase/integrase [Alsobacter sp. R-9]
MSGGKYGRGKAPERACMKVVAWPAEDRRLWEQALHGDDLFGDGGARAGRRSLSNVTVAKGYGRWLTFLAEQGWLDASCPPADRITPERVKTYIDRLVGLGNASLTVLNRIHELHSAATVMGPRHDWSFLKRLLRRLRARGRPVKSKRDRMVSADELLGLGLQLMETAQDRRTRRQQALAYRDGLIIALLALQPFRRGNLADLTLGTSLVEADGVWLLALTDAQVKNATPIEVPWPDLLVEHLRVYLDRHRPVLMALTGRCTAPIGDALWVSAHGSPLSEEEIYTRLTRITREHLGKVINPHLARDIASTTLAVADPRHVRAASPLLGHTSLVTTERHYQQAQGLDAQRRYYEELTRVREGEDVRETGTEDDDA